MGQDPSWSRERQGICRCYTGVSVGCCCDVWEGALGGSGDEAVTENRFEGDSVHVAVHHSEEAGVAAEGKTCTVWRIVVIPSKLYTSDYGNCNVRYLHPKITKCPSPRPSSPLVSYRNAVAGMRHKLCASYCFEGRLRAISSAEELQIYATPLTKMHLLILHCENNLLTPCTIG